MAWIESHQSLSRHRKTMRAAKLLSCDRHKLIGHLHELWWWGLDNADSEGWLHGIDIDEIAEAAGWRKGGFTEALTEAGFIDLEDGIYRLHDWYDYAGKLNDSRTAYRQGNRERQRRWREKQRETDATHNAPVTRDRNVTPVTRNAVSNAEITEPPYRTQPTVPNQPYPSTSDDVEGGGDDVHFRDRYGTLITAFGAHVDRRLADDFTQIAEDETLEAINTAIQQCRRDNVKCWPSEIRKRLPGSEAPVLDATQKFRSSRFAAQGGTVKGVLADKAGTP